MFLYARLPLRSVRVKLLALVDEETVKKVIESGVTVHSSTEYRETLLFKERGAFGAPEFVGIRVWNERDEDALVVHYGHNPKDHEETVMERGKKDTEMYKFVGLGFQPLGEFTIRDVSFRWREFLGRIRCVKELEMCFLYIYRDVPDSTDVFEEKQRRAWHFMRSVGVKKEQLLPLDMWMFILSTLQSLSTMSGSS